MNLEYKTKYLKYKKKYLKLKEILGGAGLTEKEREKKEKEDQIRAQFAMFGKAQPKVGGISTQQVRKEEEDVEDRKLTREEQRAEEARSRIYIPPGRRAAAAARSGIYIAPGRRAAAVGVTASKKPSTRKTNSRLAFLNTQPTQTTQSIEIKQAPRVERANEVARNQMILDEGNKFYKLINERINKDDRILIIDFENIRIKISSRIEKLKTEFNDLLLQKKNDGKITNEVYEKANQFIPKEQEHIIAWLFLIKYYLVSNEFDKIILLCKEATWDEWYEYAFSIFDNGENLKSKVFIVKLKIRGNRRHELWPKQDGSGKHSLKALDDFTMYFIKFYLEANGKKNITILTLDGRIKDDFEEYKNILYYLKENEPVRRNLNLKYKMTISHKELGFTVIKNNENVVVVENNLLNNIGSILYDYNKLKHFKMPEPPSEDILNGVFNNYFSGKDFPEIENFTYNKVVDTMEDLKTNKNISPQEFEDYKKNIIEGEGIKRSEYIIKNIPNDDRKMPAEEQVQVPAEKQVPAEEQVTAKLTQGQKKKLKKKRRKVAAAAAAAAKED